MSQNLAGIASNEHFKIINHNRLLKLAYPLPNVGTGLGGKGKGCVGKRDHFTLVAIVPPTIQHLTSFISGLFQVCIG